MPWVVQLPAEDRSWIGLILQAGVKSFIDWFRHGEGTAPVTSEVFGAAPRALAGDISLEQTVAMVRLSIVVVDEGGPRAFIYAYTTDGELLEVNLDVDELRRQGLVPGKAPTAPTAGRSTPFRPPPP